MKDRETVTTNGRAVFYAAIWNDLRQAAMNKGWALALHGSLASDMDIMAMPWTEHASSADEMIEALKACFTDSPQIRVTNTPMLNQRLVYTLSIWADFYLDINIIKTIMNQDQIQNKESKTIEERYQILETVAKKHGYVSWAMLSTHYSARQKLVPLDFLDDVILESSAQASQETSLLREEIDRLKDSHACCSTALKLERKENERLKRELLQETSKCMRYQEALQKIHGDNLCLSTCQELANKALNPKQ
jgi:hypothetical protein